MTSTTDIANLIEANTTLKQYFEGARSDIDARINSAASRWDNLYSSFYIDQNTGSDDNDGTKDAPLASLQEAIDRTPYWRMCNIRLRGNYVTTQRYLTYGRHVSLTGAYGQDWTTSPTKADRPNITISTEQHSNGSVRLNGIQSMYGSFWSIHRVNIILPSSSEVEAAHPGASFNANNASLVSRTSSSHGPAGGVYMAYYDFDISDDPYAYILGWSTGFEIIVSGFTIANPINGRVHPNIPANSSAADFGHILTTNMATL